MANAGNSAACDPCGDSRLDRVLRGGLLRAVYQPIVDLRTGHIAGAEALMRVHEEAGFAHAGELFDVATDSNMAPDLDRLAQHVAFTGAAGWPPGVLLFLNCSPSAIASPGFARSMIEQLRSMDRLNPGRVVLEVTERSEQQYVAGLTDEVRSLSEAGFQIAIDDVGAGASGLNRIMMLRPGWLKLDRELIDHIDRDLTQQNLVRFLVHFTRLSGARMIAEGIERVEELETLIRLGVPFGQGYLLARPGEIITELPSDVSRLIRSAAARRSDAGGQGLDHTPVGVLARSAPKISEHETVGAARSLVAKHRPTPGVIVSRADGTSSWVPSFMLIDPMFPASAPVSVACSEDVTTIDPGLTIDEAMRVAATQTGPCGISMMLLSSGSEINGWVALPDLLRVATDTSRRHSSSSVSLAGLPGLVPCEQRVETFACQALANLEAGESVTPSVAFIDLRGFADFNLLAGHETGDTLIIELGGVLRRLVNQHGENDDSAFLGHLGEDRFLVIGSETTVGAIASGVGDAFAEATGGGGVAVGVTDPEGSPYPLRMHTRALVQHDAFNNGRDAKAVFRFEQILRKLAGELIASDPMAGSIVIIQGGDEPSMPLAA